MAPHSNEDVSFFFTSSWLVLNFEELHQFAETAVGLDVALCFCKE